MDSFIGILFGSNLGFHDALYCYSIESLVGILLKVVLDCYSIEIHLGNLDSIFGSSLNFLYFLNAVVLTTLLTSYSITVQSTFQPFILSGEKVDRYLGKRKHHVIRHRMLHTKRSRSRDPLVSEQEKVVEPLKSRDALAKASQLSKELYG